MQANLRPFRHLAVILAAALLLLSVPGGTAPGPQLQKALHRGHEVVAGEVLVKFRGARSAAPSPDEIRWLADTDRDEELGRLGVRRLHSKSLDVAGLLAALAQRADVEYAEPNYVVHAIGTEPNDTYFGLLWGLRNIGQTIGGQAGVLGADIGATLAWDITTGSRANVVAVIDTGIDYNHPDLQANVWSAPAAFSVTIGRRAVNCAAGTHGFNAIKLTCDPMDDNSHGTHVSGTIGGSGNNGVGVVGVNWIASVMGAKFLDANGNGTIADAINAIEFAIQARQAFGAGANVRVLSNSWGGGGFSQSLLNEINKANASDMLFVASAGNAGSNNDTVAAYPANYNAPNVVAVAATDNTDQLASCSNYGATTVELGAPGVYIASTIRNNGYAYYSGTSMAAPHVSGAAALILAACALDTGWLRTTILSTVDLVPVLAGKTITGGRLDVFNALNGCLSPPAAPTGLSASVVGSQVNLAWTDNSSNEFGFRIERATNGGAWAGIGTVAANTTDYTDGTIVQSTQYSYRVFAYNAAGDSVAASNVVTVGGPLTITSLAANQTFPVAAGTAITWTATATGGAAPLQYQFWRYSYATGLWTVVQAYTLSNTFSWTPGGTEVGQYIMGVWARSVGNPTSFEASFTLPAIAITPAPVSIASLSPNVASPAPAGTAITWTAIASGGAAPLQFEFWRYSYATGLWTIVRTYGTSNVFTWNTGPADAGTYIIGVWVKSTGAAASFEASLSTAAYAIAAAALTVTGVTPDVPSPAVAGASVTWTISTTGGTAPLLYQFWRYSYATGLWTVAQPYSSSNAFTWNTAAADAAMYIIGVWVKSAGSAAAFDASFSTTAYTITR